MEPYIFAITGLAMFGGLAFLVVMAGAQERRRARSPSA
jgi:hypothetical protein